MQPAAVAALQKEGAIGAASLAELVGEDGAAARDLADGAGGGGRPGARRARRRCSSRATSSSTAATRTTATTSAAAEACSASGHHYVDVGTSGGVAGLERGYCLMIGGEAEIVERLTPIFAALAPGIDAAARTPGRARRAGERRAGLPALRPARRRPLRQDGPQRHRVRPDGGVRRGPQHPAATPTSASASTRRRRRDDAAAQPRVLPVRHEPARDRRGLAPRQRDRLLAARPDRAARCRRTRSSPHYGGRVSDSGEGRWTIEAAIDEAVPAHVLSAALYERFSSRGEADFANRVLSAMRHEFGGHVEKKV